MAKSYLRYPDNWLVGTRRLTLEERGAYADLLDLYISRDGDLPNNDRHMAYDLACDLRVWKRIKQALLDAGKIEILKDVVVPTHAATTLATCVAKSVAAKDAANSRWRKRSINPLKNNETDNAGAYAAAVPIKTRQDISTSTNVEDAAPSLWEAGVSYLTQRGQSEQSARSILGKWRKSFSDSVILAAVIDCQKQNPVEPVSYITRILKAEVDEYSPLI